MTGKAALYTRQAPPDPVWFQEMRGVVAVETSEAGGKLTQYRVTFDNAYLTINVMPQQQLQDHLAGFQGYIRHLHAQSPNAHSETIAAKLQTIQTVLGCVIEPGWDEAGQVEAALFTLNALQDGLLFSLDTVFGAEGDPLIGRLAEDESGA